MERTASVVEHIVFPRIVIGGDGDGIFHACTKLTDRGFGIERPDFNTLVVANVFEEDFHDLQEIIAQHNLHVRDFGNRETVCENKKRPVKLYTSKAEFVSEMGAWYRTNNEEYPLLVLVNIWTEEDTSPTEVEEEKADDVKLVEVNLVAPDSLPIPVTMTLDELKKYGPKPATVSDFEDLDLPIPSDYQAPVLPETTQ